MSAAREYYYYYYYYYYPTHAFVLLRRRCCMILQPHEDASHVVVSGCVLVWYACMHARMPVRKLQLSNTTLKNAGDARAAVQVLVLLPPAPELAVVRHDGRAHFLEVYQLVPACAVCAGRRAFSPARACECERE